MFGPIRRIWKVAASAALLGVGLFLVLSAPAAAPRSRSTAKPRTAPSFVRAGRNTRAKVRPADAVLKGDVWVFAPLNGTRLADNSSPNSSLKSPTVNLIFAGNAWSAADRQTVLHAVQSILNGPYLSRLSQANYGSDGRAFFGKSLSSTATPSLDTKFKFGLYPSQGSMNTFVQGLPTGSNPNTVNVVVNDPQDSKGTVGVNYPTTNGGEIYVGTATGAGGAIDKDLFSELFSHEIAEAMTSAVQVTNPGGFDDGADQICDNEPEEFGYYHSVPGSYTDDQGKTVQTTNMVQAYWSQKDGAWVVPNGGNTAAKRPAVKKAGKKPGLKK
jgi:hypothetical protein